MSEHPEPDPEQKKRSVRQLHEAIEKMSIDELSDLLSDIYAKISELKQGGK
jgi:hypothetical protein